jgi:Flp pilus assembly protein TadG
MAIVNLTYNGTTYRVLCNNVTVGGTKSVDVKPYANISGPVEGQTLAYENLTFNIQGIHYTGDSGTLTWDKMLEMYTHIYDNNAIGEHGPIILNVTYGDSSVLTGLSGLADIKVLVKTFSLPLDAKNSKGAYLPVGNITLVETA